MALSSNYSGSTLFASPQSSPTLSPATIVYSTPTVSSTIQSNSTDSPSAQTTPGPTPQWESDWLGNNPYLPSWYYTDLYGEISTTMNSEEQFLLTTCGPIWSSSLVNWISSELATGAEFMGPTTIYGDPISWAQTKWDFPFTATSPCCNYCTFTAGDVEVYHWQQATPAPSISTLVNSDGFTL